MQAARLLREVTIHRLAARVQQFDWSLLQCVKVWSSEIASWILHGESYGATDDKTGCDSTYHLQPAVACGDLPEPAPQRRATNAPDLAKPVSEATTAIRKRWNSIKPTPTLDARQPKSTTEVTSPNQGFARFTATRYTLGVRVRGRTSPVGTMISSPHWIAVVVTWLIAVSPADAQVSVVV